MLSPNSFETKLTKACGIDMHKDSIKACYLFSDKGPIIQDFGTQTDQSRLLCKDLQFYGIGDVVIESTDSVRHSRNKSRNKLQ